MLFISALYWFVFAAVVACIEIEAEGKFGWAEKMPTWYRTTGFAAALYCRLMGGKPLTGYHLFMFFFPVMLFHAPFFMGVAWSVSAELMAWSMYFAWCVLWDFLWFVLNPHYGIKNFKREKIWWHAKSIWVFGLFPMDYLVGVVLSLVCATAAAHVAHDPHVSQDQLRRLVAFAGFTVILILNAPVYHRWRRSMDLRDDRDKVNAIATGKIS